MKQKAFVGEACSVERCRGRGGKRIQEKRDHAKGSSSEEDNPMSAPSMPPEWKKLGGVQEGKRSAGKEGKRGP